MTAPAVQIPLFRADGTTYSPDRDGERLERLFERVKALMLDGRWRTLAEIQAVCGGSEASVSARIRDLRKKRFGAYIVEREYVGDGLWQYRVRTRAANGADANSPAASRLSGHGAT